MMFVPGLSLIIHLIIIIVGQLISLFKGLTTRLKGVQSE